MAKLLLIIMALGALIDGLSSTQSEPPLLIDASQPNSPALDAND
ncbi:hypothetical protein [Sphingomonas daechungensis]|nr:hypothetical protein [Sphingomonas daechungensis]